MSRHDRFVWDREEERLLGRFEEMYAAEEVEGFDSWRERDLRPLRKRISLAILESYQFGKILDVGCGKGTFTHLLKKTNNRVVGIDVSPTAVARAARSYPDVDFRCMDAMALDGLGERFDLAVAMGVLVYLPEWEALLDVLAGLAGWIYVCEDVPPRPVGFVRSGEELLGALSRRFVVETKAVVDDRHWLALGRLRTGARREARP